jgi:hypothetical protein
VHVGKTVHPTQMYVDSVHSLVLPKRHGNVNLGDDVVFELSPLLTVTGRINRVWHTGPDGEFACSGTVSAENGDENGRSTTF